MQTKFQMVIYVISLFLDSAFKFMNTVFDKNIVKVEIAEN